MLRFAPVLTLPLMPIPPTTTKAPVVVFVLAVALAATMLPLAVYTPELVNVVKDAVPGVTLPIACACNPAVLVVVNTAVPGVTLPMACACRPPAVAVLNVVAPVTPNVVCSVVAPVAVSVVKRPGAATLAPMG